MSVVLHVLSATIKGKFLFYCRRIFTVKLSLFLVKGAFKTLNVNVYLTHYEQSSKDGHQKTWHLQSSYIILMLHAWRIIQQQSSYNLKCLELVLNAAKRGVSKFKLVIVVCQNSSTELRKFTKYLSNELLKWD